MADGLTGRQRRHLRALGHHLQPVVQVGHEGITEALVHEAGRQLETHELIKVRIGESSPQDRYEAAELLAQKTGAQVAQVLGRTALLYRPRKDKPGIVLPK
ncbi:MAG TPA: ribosome assembly RNA-binding protein YhbY [Myxococcales bacterium]|nr:ribosome assembly RNA-binding protein YhbY [Myxococcales bacterium]